MSTSLNNMQSMLASGLEPTSLAEQFNRRLAALLTAGTRYGVKGDGFFIDDVVLRDVYNITSESFTAVIRGVNDVVVGESADNPYYVPPERVQDASIISGVLCAVSRFIGSSCKGYPMTLVLDPSTRIRFFCSTSTDRPVVSAEPLYLDSSAFRYLDADESVTDAFGASFTLAVVYNDSGDGDPEYDVSYFGVGIDKDGKLLYNGRPTGTDIRGTDGAPSQTYFISASNNLSENSGGLSYTITGPGVYLTESTGDMEWVEIAEEGYLTTEDGLEEKRPWKDAGKNNVRLALPTGDFIKQTNIADGAAVFTFLTERDSNGDLKVYSGILNWSSDKDGWLPVQSGPGSVFTFESIFSVKALSTQIRKSMDEYYAGESEYSGSMFKIDTLRFKDSNTVVYQTPRFVTYADGLGSGRFCVTTAKIQTTPLPVLSVRYDRADSTGEGGDFREMLKENELFNTLLETTPFNRGYAGDGTTKLNTSLPLVYLDGAALFCPNIVNSARVYGAGKDCGANQKYGTIPFFEQRGADQSWGVLRMDNGGIGEHTLVNSNLEPFLTGYRFNQDGTGVSFHSRWKDFDIIAVGGAKIILNSLAKIHAPSGVYVTTDTLTSHFSNDGLKLQNKDTGGESLTLALDDNKITAKSNSGLNILETETLTFTSGRIREYSKFKFNVTETSVNALFGADGTWEYTPDYYFRSDGTLTGNIGWSAITRQNISPGLLVTLRKGNESWTVDLGAASRHGYAQCIYVDDRNYNYRSPYYQNGVRLIQVDTSAICVLAVIKISFIAGRPAFCTESKWKQLESIPSGRLPEVLYPGIEFLIPGGSATPDEDTKPLPDIVPSLSTGDV